ncbi:MAG: lysylphosphatidylglycerol synthase transmembrane domain-containing protein [Candidatus Bathyarchaeia archaeon]
MARGRGGRALGGGAGFVEHGWIYRAKGIPRASIFRILLLAAVGLFSYAAILFLIGFGEIAREISKADIGVLSLSILASVIGSNLYILGWWVLLRRANLSCDLKRTFGIMWSDIFLDQALPAGSFSGEAMRIYLTTKDTIKQIGVSLATIIIHRLFSILPFLATSCIGLIYLFDKARISPSIGAAIVALITPPFIISGSLALLMVNDGLAKRGLEGLTRLMLLLGERWRAKASLMRERGLSLIAQYREGIQAISSEPIACLASLSLCSVSFLLELSIPILVLISLGRNMPFLAIVTVYVIGMTIQSMPLFIPGMMGITEAAMTALFSILSLSPAEAASAAILIRIPMFWSRLLIGGIVTIHVFRNLGKWKGPPECCDGAAIGEKG